MDILIWSLIIYRISTDIAYMSGPFLVFERLRTWCINYAPVWMAEGVNCPICISFWLALGLVLYTQDYRMFAVAGVVALVVRFTP